MCTHYFQIETWPDNGLCKGICKLCGAEDSFIGNFDAMTNRQKKGMAYQFEDDAKPPIMPNRIREFRLKAGIRQIDLAKQVNMLQSNLCAIEQGRARTGNMSRHRISTALDVPEENLFP